MAGVETEIIRVKKTCSVCGLPKSLDEFHEHPTCKGGRRHQCKLCLNARNKAFSNPKFHTCEYLMLTSARHRALQLGVTFDLTLEDIVVPVVCPLLGITLQRGVGSGGRVDSSPSLDRKDPSKGYTRDNVWVISWRANKLKSDAMGDEIRLLARRITENGL